MSESTKKQMPDLSGFYGTEHYYQHWTKAGVFTDGIKHLADQCGAYWLIDLAFSHQHKPKVKAEEFQLWELTLDKEGPGCVVTMRHDTGTKPIVQQKVEYTDFPENFSFYLTRPPVGYDGGEVVMMLKSEY